MSDGTFLVAFVLTVHWLTYLVTRSDFPPVEAVRFALVKWVDAHPSSRFASAVDYLVTCPWCVSPYISGILVSILLVTRDGGVPNPVLVALAAASYTGTVQSVLDRINRPSNGAGE